MFENNVRWVGGGILTINGVTKHEENARIALPGIEWLGTLEHIEAGQRGIESSIKHKSCFS